MKKNYSANKQANGTSDNQIPNIEVIDLEMDGNDASSPSQTSDNEQHEEPAHKKSIRSFLNMHMLLLCVFVIFVGFIVIRFSNWGEFINISDIVSDDSANYRDILDQILPVTDENGHTVETDKAEKIVVFGNAPFADDRDSEDNLANLIAKESGATVYNCSIGGSYMAARRYYFDPNEKPMDAYSFYWLITLAVNGNNAHYYKEAAAALGDAIPPEAQEVYDTLTTLDFNTVDVVAIMYDATDYLLGHEIYDISNPTNIQQFTGNMEAGIELLKQYYPHIRIIVMSPTYAYAINEEGEYVSSDMYTYGDQSVLSTYVIKQSDSCVARMVTFVDNLYGTITGDNAQKYLTDNLHLNLEGRKKVAERFIYALNYFDKE